MCGIAGVYGYNALRLSLLITLGQLSRGTQGTGIAWLDNNKIRILKEPIHPIKFVKKHYHKLDSKIRVAIAHNRQPSRGNVSYYNTHPFMSCRRQFALIHNGTCLINHHLVSKIKRKHKILGDTDSEIVCHMLEEFYDEYGDMVSAIEELFTTDFSGAILVITKDGRIFGAKKSWAPLHYAKADNHVFLASEASAINSVLDHDAEIFALKSKQIIEVHQGSIRVHGEGEDVPQIKYYVSSYYYAPRKASYPYAPWAYDWDFEWGGYQEL